MSRPKQPTGKVFEMDNLFPALRKYCIDSIARRGCRSAEQCGTDVLTEYLVDRNLRAPGRGKFDKERILINFPNARDQLRVLYELLRHEVRGKQSHCKECKFRQASCGINDDSSQEDDGERRTRQVSLIDTKDSEQIYRDKELLNKYLEEISDPVQKWALLAHIFEGLTHTEIARRLRRKPQTVRQWFARNSKRIARSLRRPSG